MATKLQIFNTALGNIGVSDYLTDTAGPSKAHKVLNQMWPMVLAELLSLDVDWSFTRRRATLPQSVDYYESFAADVLCEAQQFGGFRIPAPVVVTAQTSVFSPSSVGMKISILGEAYPFEVVSYVSPTQVVCEARDNPFTLSAVSCSIAGVAPYVERFPVPINWAYVFEAPAECLRIRYIEIPGLRKFGKRHAIEHEVVRIHEAEVPEVSPERVVTLIYCDVPEIEIVYSASLGDSEIPAMPPSVAYALACLLAARIALPMSMKPEVMNLNMQTYNDALSEAIAQEVNEGETGVPPTPELLDGRTSLADWR